MDYSNDAVKKVEVIISGEVFTLIADENESYIHQLARYIDKKTNDIMLSKSNANINPATRSLLLAINIADDFFKEREKNGKVVVNEDAINKLTEENKALFDKVQALEEALAETKRELEEYIEAFDTVTPRIKTIPQYRSR